jgi:hypothetical protein
MKFQPLLLLVAEAALVVGGLTVSIFLTMVYVPILYSLFEDLQSWAGGLVHRPEPLADEG